MPPTGDAHRLPRALVLVGNYPPAWRAGGPLRSVHSAVLRASSGYEVRVLTGATDLFQTELLVEHPNTWVRRPEAEVAYLHGAGLRARVRALRLLWRLRAWHPEVVYLNSFFNALYSILPQLYRRLGGWRGTHLVVAVRGEFGPAALAVRSRKKRWFLWLHRRLGLGRGVVWQASSEREAADVRAVLGAEAVVMVRPNDTMLSPPGELRLLEPRPDTRLRALFVGRVVPVKGLDVLLRGLALVRTPVVVEVVGPREDAAYADLCERLAAELPDHVQLTMAGPVEGDRVAEVMSRADVLLMPTLGENFGHAIAESLSVSTPVVAMDVTPWTDVLAGGGGVVVPGADARSWADAIERLCATDAEERAAARRATHAAFDRWWRTQPAGDVFTDVLDLVARR